MRRFLNTLATILLACGLLGVLPAGVQAGSSLGLTVGVNSAGFQGSDTSGSKASGTYRFTGGLFFREELREWFALEPSLLYTQKGGNAGWVPGAGWPPRTDWYDLRLGYLELPILARFGLPFQSKGGLRFDVLAGPYFAVTLSSTMESTWGGSAQVKAELGDVRPIDVGGVVGLGLVVPTGSGALGVDLRYGAGFLSIQDTERAPDVRNSGLVLTTYYSHVLGRR